MSHSDLIDLDKNIRDKHDAASKKLSDLEKEGETHKKTLKRAHDVGWREDGNHVSINLVKMILRNMTTHTRV